MENERLIWFERPTLNKPYMIIAFQGWSNAGEVPSSVMWYMISRFKAALFAEMKPDDFYSYQSGDTESKRPIVNIEKGFIKSFSIITTNFWYHQASPGGHDVVFIAGPEPEQRWADFASIILELAQEYEVEKIVALGGTFDAIPHTVPPRITGVVTGEDLKEELERQGIELVNYKGPSSIHTLLMVNAARIGIPMMSLWTHTPHYIQVVNFMACYSLMSKLSNILNLSFDLDVARRDSEYLYAQVNDAIEKKPELQEYLRALEIEYNKGKTGPQEPINKNIIKEIEDLFKDKPG